jgi:tripartite-type tricarboxylate transporter receptor subunit TctC
VSSTSRSPLLPDLPTISEAGVPGYSASSWFGIFAPAGVSSSVLQTLNRAIARAMSDPSLRKKMEARGADAHSSSPEEFRRFVTSEYDRYGKLITEAHLRIE